MMDDGPGAGMSWPNGFTRPFIEPSDDLLRADLGIPDEAETRRLWIPGERYGPTWRKYMVEVFGVVRGGTAPSQTGLLYVLDDSVLTPVPHDWPSLAHAVSHHYGDRSDQPALDVWQRIVWVDGCHSYLEWRWRPEEIIHRHIDREVRIGDAIRVLRGRRLLRLGLSLPGPGRPSKLGPDPEAKISAAERDWTKATGAQGKPTLPALADRLGVHPATIRRSRARKANTAQ